MAKWVVDFNSEYFWELDESMESFSHKPMVVFISTMITLMIESINVMNCAAFKR